MIDQQPSTLGGEWSDANLPRDRDTRALQNGLEVIAGKQIRIVMYGQGEPGRGLRVVAGDGHGIAVGVTRDEDGLVTFTGHRAGFVDHRDARAHRPDLDFSALTDACRHHPDLDAVVIPGEGTGWRTVPALLILLILGRGDRCVGAAEEPVVDDQIAINGLNSLLT